MNNRERDKVVESYHLFIALRRTKENRGMQELCFRQVIKDNKIDLDIIKDKIKNLPGTWRIYQTINKRNIIPARKLLMKFLIDDPERFEHRIDSLWKNCLLKKECKSERNFLVDIDCDIIPEEIGDLINNGEIKVDETIKTPNGWHLICRELDTRKLQGIKEVEVKRDDLKFVEILKND